MSSSSKPKPKGGGTTKKTKKEKERWSDAELHALIMGVSRYGSCRRPGIAAPWRSISSDAELQDALSRRTKYNACKDKYRNLPPGLRIIACARFMAYFA